MDKISIDLMDLMDIVSEFIIDQQEANPMEMAPYCEYAFKKYQPERSKREDADKCIKCGKTYWDEPQGYICMRCGTLNTMET